MDVREAYRVGATTKSEDYGKMQDYFWKALKRKPRGKSSDEPYFAFREGYQDKLEGKIDYKRFPRGYKKNKDLFKLAQAALKIHSYPAKCKYCKKVIPNAEACEDHIGCVEAAEEKAYEKRFYGD